MAKIFIAANSMIIGGIENSLISLLQQIDLEKNEVTLLLQNKKGKLLDQIPNKVKVIEYQPIKHKNILIRKIKNRMKFINFILKHKNKYDVSICYASYIYLPSIIVRKICKNNYMWVHTDYTKIYSKKDLDNFIKLYGYSEYQHLVFVSSNALDNYKCIYKKAKQTYLLCRNILPFEEIIQKSNEAISYTKSKKITFLNVSRHDEPAKKISRIIEAADMLRNDGLDFQILLIGNGEDTNYYKKLVEEKDLDSFVEIIDEVINPFPYYKIVDYFILTSEYEGGPITIYESLILKTPVITTDVGDVRQYVNNNNGIIISKNIMSLYKTLKKVLISKQKFNVSFDYIKFNQQSIKTIHKIIGVENEI